MTTKRPRAGDSGARSEPQHPIETLELTMADRTPYCHKIRYGISGAPILDGDDMDGSHAPGVGVAPTLIELVYSAARDGKPASVSASVTGQWTRFGKREPFDDQMTTHFKNGPDGWPAWLAEEARLHDPAVLPPPADRAAVLLEAAQHLRTLADGASRGVWLGMRAAADEMGRLAAEAQPELEADPQPVSEEFLQHLATAKVREDDGAEAQQPDTETRGLQRPGCTCSHAADEHSVYGCADGCGCEWMPKRKPMDPVHILGIDAEPPAVPVQPAADGLAGAPGLPVPPDRSQGA